MIFWQVRGREAERKTERERERIEEKGKNETERKAEVCLNFPLKKTNCRGPGEIEMDEKIEEQ